MPSTSQTSEQLNLKRHQASVNQSETDNETKNNSQIMYFDNLINLKS